MQIYFLYFLILGIFIFIITLSIKSVNRGIKAKKNLNKKKSKN